MKVVRSSASGTGRLYPQECFWYSFSLGAESTSGSWCGWKVICHWKIQWHQRESISGPSTTPPQAPINIYIYIYLYIYLCKVMSPPSLIFLIHNSQFSYRSYIPPNVWDKLFNMNIELWKLRTTYNVERVRQLRHRGSSPGWGNNSFAFRGAQTGSGSHVASLFYRRQEIFPWGQSRSLTSNYSTGKNKWISAFILARLHGVHRDFTVIPHIE